MIRKRTCLVGILFLFILASETLNAQCAPDVTPPDITCPADIVVNNSPGFCGEIVNYADATATDFCGTTIVYLFSGLPSGSTFPVGISVVTFEAMDESGNTAQCSFNITVVDNEPPILTCQSDITVNNDAGQCSAVVNFVNPVGVDNCPGVSTIQTTGLPSGSTFPVGTTLQTFQSTDASGLITTCSFNIIVNDTELPQISCPANIVTPHTVGTCGTVVNFVEPIGTDNCPGVGTVQTTGLPSGSTFPVGTTVQTYVVTDASGNSVSCSFNITVTDTELPVITCPNDTTVVNTPGFCGRPVTYSVPVGTDNCPGVTTARTAGLASGATFPVGITTVTYQATDASGNTASCSFDVTVLDVQFPLISCPANIVRTVTPGTCGRIVFFPTPSGSDNCPGYVVTQTAGLPSGSEFPVGVTTVTFQITDASGNATSCSFTITVNDNELPTITCPANLSVSNDPGVCGAIVNFADPAFSDNCPGAVLSQTGGLPSGSTFPVGTTTNSFLVTDAAGNTAACSFDVTVNDTEIPVITCPADIVQTADPGVCEANVTIGIPVNSDNCGVLSLVNDNTGTNDASAIYPVGTTTVTYTITDIYGNINTCSFDVTITDNELPTITCPADISQSTDPGMCDAAVSVGIPVTADNCGIAALTNDFTGTNDASGTYPQGTTLVTYTVTDINGNTNTCSFNVVINDAEFPVINCPADIIVNNDPGVCGAIINFVEPTGTDNCPGAVTVQIAGLPSGATYPVGTTTSTFEVTDASGNSSQCSFDVTVNDTELPVISCPANIVVANDPGVCGAVVNFADPVGTDNCPGAVTAIISGLPSGSTYPVGLSSITFEVTDASGNTAQCSFDITVNDTELPVINCPADIVVSNDPGSCDAVVNFVSPVGTDNCPGAVTSQIAGMPSGSTFPLGTTTITFEVTDASGNTAQCSFDITVNDTELPVINCPADINVSNDGGNCDAVVTFVDPVGTDNCLGALTIQIAGLPSGSNFPVGTTVNTFEVTDASGNTDQCSFNVVVSDAERPVINCPADIVVNNDPGVCGAVVSFVDPIGTDNCPGVITVQTAGLPSGSTYPIGTTVVTFTSTDANGNVAACSFNVTVNDTELPVIICPADIIVSNDAGQCDAVVNFVDPAGTDNCPGSVTTQTAGLPSGSAYPIGTTTITFEVTDVSGNTAQCSFDITINDTELPVINCPADIVVSNDPGTCDAVVNFVDPVGTDNCPGAVTTQIAGMPSGSTFPLGTTTITFEVTDASGNTAQCSFNITVNDTELPVINCPADIVVSNDPGTCDAVVNFVDPLGTDNCPASVTVQIAGLPSGSAFPIGTTVNTFEVTDAFGNTAQCSFNVTVNETELPVIICPADIVVSNDPGTCDAVVNFVDPIGTDNCPGSVTVQIAGLPSGSSFPIGTTTNTFEVTDASGNTAQCSFTVTVNDTELPVIVCPADIVVSNDAGQCDAVVNFVDPAGTDNCPGATTAQIGGMPSGSTFPLGTTTITFEVTDASGNTAQCSFNITVNDTEAPVLNCPVDITVSNDAGQCDAVVNFSDPVGTDNCPGVVTVQIAGPVSGSTFPVGTTVITYESTDAGGNTAQCSFNINVNDTELPVINCPADISVPNDPGVCDAVVNFADPVGTDNCPGAVTVQIAGLPSGSAFPTGTTVNTFEVTDAAGNTAQCSFNVTVQELTPPTITCPADVISNNDPGVCGAAIVYPDPVALDNCPGVTFALSTGFASGATFPVGTTLVTYIATDASGNTDQCTFNVTVNDVENPVIVCPADIIVSNDAGQCDAVVTFADPVGTDNCPGATTVQVAGLPSGSTYPLGTTTNTFEVTDAYGNTAQCSFNIIVNDTEVPVINCPSDIIASNDAGQCDALVNFVDPVGTDNCPGAVTVQIAGLPSGSIFPFGTTTNTFEVTDAAGNTTQCSFNVIVNDTELPVIACPADIIVSNDAGQCDAIVNFVDPVGTDNCPGAVTVQIAGLPSGSAFPSGTTVNTFEVTDASGNTAQCSFNVTVNDTEAPIIVCPADISVNNDAIVCGAVVNFVDPVGTDNCPGSATVQTAGLASGSTFPVGVTIVTFEVTDAAGNTSNCSFNVTVTDNELPTISCPANITQSNDAGVCEALVSVVVVTGDNCGVLSVVNDFNGTADASDTYPAGTTTVNYVVTDINGNINNTCSFDITITDDENPLISCPSNISQPTDPGVCNAVIVVPAPDNSDNCGVASLINDFNGTSDASDTYGVGTTTVLYTVTDLSGNTNTCTFNVTITELIPPTITCPADVNQGVDPGLCTATVAVPIPVTADNCGVLSVINDFNGTSDASDTYFTGTTTVTYTVMDLAGNTATCSFDVTIIENIPPTISCPATIIQTADAGVCEASVIVPNPTPGDNCLVASVINDYNGTSDASDIYPVGTTTVTFTVTDASGNTAMCSFNITVTDDEDPTIIPPANIQTYPNNAGCTAIVDLGIPTTADSCGVLSVTNDAPATYTVGTTTTVIWTVEDVNGNISTATQTVEVLPLTSTIQETVCDSYTAPDGAIYDTSGTYVAVVPGSFGCDSTITINLTVNESTFSEITVQTCVKYIAPNGDPLSTSGTYTAVIQNAAGCDSTITIKLTIDLMPSVDLTTENNVLEAVQSGMQYQWIDCDGVLPISGATNQTFAPLESNNYAVIVTNGTCIDTSVCVPISFDLIIPEVFTPNGDGENDYFEIEGIFDFPENVLEVYNRWGNLVYKKEGYTNDWDGTNTQGLSIGDKLPVGTYFYTLDLGVGKEVKPMKGYIYITK